jgi:2,4-dienoyl-CoA reductase-like NADH-dependent reductase (Old Yellow Enzyme family)/thioredoxin reductase
LTFFYIYVRLSYFHRLILNIQARLITQISFLLKINMERKYPHLFSPFKIKNTTFKNRVVASPIGDWRLSPHNYMVDYVISEFEAKAAGGPAAVTFGHTEVNAEEPDTDGFGLYFNLRKREGIAAIAEFAAAIKQHGALAGLQLNYSGYYGPSDSLSRGKTMKGMTDEKIMQTIGQYATCARQLKVAGFDICMIHGAHGWLPMQFLSADVNRRTDKWGGSFENRMRFPLMLVDAIREAIGQDMLIEYRVSGYDPGTQPELFEESVAFIKAIEKKVDLVHVSSGAIASQSSGGSGHTFPTYLEPAGLNIHLAAALKKRVSVPIAVVGNITEPDMAERIIAEGQADLVALGRAFIADPEWTNKVRRGQEAEIRPCLECYNCLEVMHHNHYLGCDVNPRSGREHRFGEVTPAKVSHKVAVVGGGPAGMQAAITAAERGHQVTLYEKTGQLGGILKITDNDPIKSLVRKYKAYLIRQVNAAGVKVKLNTEATPALIESSHPDVIIVASGSRHIIPEIPGINLPHVFTAIAAHQPGAAIGNRVAIIGGNMVGCETALFVRELGKEVTVVEMTDRLHADANWAVGPSLEDHMEKGGVRRITGARCTGISTTGVQVAYQTGKTEIIPADSVILAVGMRSNDDVFQTLYNCAPEVIAVGDCLKPGTIRQASRTGYFTARDI